MIPKETLDMLIEAILAQQSFDYPNFKKAQKQFEIAGTKGKCITIDRITLYIYESNLERHDLDYVRARLYEKYTVGCTREDKQKWDEYYSLLRFLLENQNLWDYAIRKEERPDFVLTDGSKKIAIEATEFTTKQDSILREIIGHASFGIKTECELQKTARQKYRGAADEYIYRNRNGCLSVSRSTYGMATGINHYATIVVNKYKKYQAEFYEYDEFIVLCDARNCLEVTERRDSERVIGQTKLKENSSGGCMVCIMRVDENSRICVDTFHLQGCEELNLLSEE